MAEQNEAFSGKPTDHRYSRRVTMKKTTVLHFVLGVFFIHLYLLFPVVLPQNSLASDKDPAEDSENYTSPELSQMRTIIVLYNPWCRLNWYAPHIYVEMQSMPKYVKHDRWKCGSVPLRHSSSNARGFINRYKRRDCKYDMYHLKQEDSGHEQRSFSPSKIKERLKETGFCGHAADNYPLSKTLRPGAAGQISQRIITPPKTKASSEFSSRVYRPGAKPEHRDFSGTERGARVRQPDSGRKNRIME
jgi:hypothetical protein